MKKINDLENLAKKYRRDLFEKLLIIKQGHPGSIFSTEYNNFFDILFNLIVKSFLLKVYVVNICFFYSTFSYDFHFIRCNI